MKPLPRGRRRRMLDWNRIDNEKTFQRLVNHLFALECNSPGFIPSSPYIGADGGWDGRYDGPYPPEGESGIWSIQAKWTKKSLTEAESALVPEIRGELANAQSNGVNHLRIATNADLTIPQVTNLQALNHGEVVSLGVWHREELTRRIELQPWVRHRFFGDPQYPAFVPWDTYFDAVEKQLLPDSGDEINGFRLCLAKAEDFVRSSDSSILLIHGPAGHGKSHLLREIARGAHRVDGGRQCWMVRAGQRRMDQAVQDELVAGRRFLLLLDDADRFPDDVRTLVSLCRHQRQCMKMVLASSAAGIRTIRDILLELQCEQLCEELGVERWSKDDLVQLLRISSAQESVQDEQAIAATLANPFLIVWAGRRIRSDSSIDLGDLKSTFINQLNHDARVCLSKTLNGDEVRHFMVDLATMVPFPRDHDVLRRTLAERYGFSDRTLVRVLDKLECAGVLTQTGRIVRFDPQVKGELYLAFELEAARDADKVESLLQTWMLVCGPSALTNLCAAGRHVDLPHVATALSRIVQGWTLIPQQTPPRERTARLSALVQLSRLIPEDCVDLLHAYLDEDRRLPGGAGNGARPKEASLPSPDDYGPALSELVSIPSIRRHVVLAIEKLAALPRETLYHNYSAPFLIRRCVSPIYNSAALVDRTLDTLAFWVESPDGVRIKLLSAALSELLAAAHEYSRSYGDRVELGAKVLKVSPEILQTRDKALGILEAMLMHVSQEVKVAGIDVTADLGQAWMAKVSDVELPLSGRIAEERGRLVAVIAGLIGPTADFELLNAIENLFLDWWAMERPGTEGVSKHLVEFPRTPEYLVYRHYVSPERAVMDFQSLAAQAPVDGRWPWFVDNVRMRPSHWRTEDFAGLVGVLATEFPSETEVVGLLNDLESHISAHSVWAQPPIVRCWVGESPDVFARIRSDGTLWPRVPDRFKREIDIALGSTDTAALAAQAEELLSTVPDISSPSLDALLISILLSDVDRTIVHGWMSDLIAKATPDQCCSIIFRLPFIFVGSENAGHLADLLTVALSQHGDVLAKCTTSVWVAVRRALEHRESLDPDCVAELGAALLQALQEVPRLEFHARDLLKFALDGIDSAVEFVEHRLLMAARLSEGKALDEPFEAFPYMDNVEAIPLQVSSLHDFAVIMDLLLTWSSRPGVRVALGVETLTETVAALRDQDTGRLYLQDFAEACVEFGEISKALEAARFLPLQPDTAEFLVAVAENAIQTGEAWKAEALLRHHMRGPGRLMYWAGELSGSEGLLTNRRDLFETMYQRAPGGQLRSIIKRCRDALGAELESPPPD
jgi:hypothetical protein